MQAEFSLLKLLNIFPCPFLVKIHNVPLLSIINNVVSEYKYSFQVLFYSSICGKTALRGTAYKTVDEIIPNDSSIFYLYMKFCIFNAY